jgi:hypothetical protein
LRTRQLEDSVNSRLRRQNGGIESSMRGGTGTLGIASMYPKPENSTGVIKS